MRHDASRIAAAYAALGLTGPANPDVLATAFRAAVKAARPDLPGGDDERFRRVIAAYRLIQQQGGVRTALAAPDAVVETTRVAPTVVGVTPLQALNGGSCEIRLGERTLRVSVVPGVRTGDCLRLRGGGDGGADLYLPVLIRSVEGLSALGDDLHMTWPVSPRLIEDGGRVEIDTHAGPRGAWVTPGLTVPVRIRLRNLGLPARSGRPAGHLFVTLQPSEDAPSAAEHLLARFTRVWTSERLAA